MVAVCLLVIFQNTGGSLTPGVGPASAHHNGHAVPRAGGDGPKFLGRALSIVGPARHPCAEAHDPITHVQEIGKGKSPNVRQTQKLM